MADKNYFYAGMGAILIIAFLGIAAIVYSPSPQNDEVKLTISLSEETSLGIESYSVHTTEDKLFSKDGVILKFDGVAENFECKIGCEKKG